MNRVHYENLRWILGSVLTVASLVILLVSFIPPAVNDLRVVLALRISSLALFLFLFAYSSSVDPSITTSIDRCYEIEEELKEMGFVSPVLRRIPVPRLHASIRARKQRKGLWNTAFLLIVVVFAWTVLFILFFER